MKTSRIAAGAALVALAVTLIAADVADAGGRRGAGRGHKGGPAQALDLTDDQKTQAKALHETFRAEAEALRESDEANREAFQALRESHRERFQAILTDEQSEQLETLRAEREANRPEDGRQGHGRHRRGRGGDGERPDLGDALGLSEDQSAQIEARRTDLRSQLEALRESGEGSREEAKALIGAHREQIQSLLTEEQRGALEELKGDRAGRRHSRRHGGGDGDEATETETEAAQKSNASVETRTWGSVKSGTR
jgi:Spy/CpxP family protein refolding chaperone